ncbi:type II secretion system protein [bacterium]|nr:type II secretion system protein [bacterium]
MKSQLKSGFTLAEVLITMAIIGIVAAIVMPAMITSYQYKTVGVKLSKFAATVENSSRAYVVSNDSFKSDTEKGKTEINTYLNESLIFKDILVPSGITSGSEYKTGLTGNSSGSDTEISLASQGSLIGYMKDNTKVQALLLSENDPAVNWSKTDTTYKMARLVQTKKVGEPSFKLVFDPAVSGLPKDAHKAYTFVVTELGYMFPAANDDCLWSIYTDDWTTNSKTFVKGGACSLSKKSTGD